MFRSGGSYHVRYLRASASFAVFVWAGGYEACAHGAAITQSRTTAAEAPINGDEAPVTSAEAPCSGQQVLCMLASIACDVCVWAGGFEACAQPRVTAAEPPNNGAEVPITAAEATRSDQHVLYVLAPISFAVFVWAGGFEACAQGAAI